jgi:hypothetical protein
MPRVSKPYRLTFRKDTGYWHFAHKLPQVMDFAVQGFTAVHEGARKSRSGLERPPRLPGKRAEYSHSGRHF